MGDRFHGSIPSFIWQHIHPSYGNNVSKWVKAIATQKNDAKTVVQFIHKNIFTHFGTPRCIISDEGSHFYNIIFSSLLGKYNVRHVKSLFYHP